MSTTKFHTHTKQQAKLYFNISWSLNCHNNKCLNSDFKNSTHIGRCVCFDLIVREVGTDVQRIYSGGWSHQWSVVKWCNGKAPKHNSMCKTGHVWIFYWFLSQDNATSHNATIAKQFFGPKKSEWARTHSVFATFSTCWLLFVPKSEFPLEGAPLWHDFWHPESRDKHHCKSQLLQRHPEAVWPCKSVCTVTSDLCRNKTIKV